MRDRLCGLVLVLSLCAAPGCSTKTASNPPAEQQGSDVAVAPQADSTLVALGNEPFWNVRVSATEIVFADPEHQDGYKFQPAIPTREGDSDVYRSTRTVPASEGPQTLELRIRNASCSDGMSDKQYPMSATLKIGDVTHTGCAEYRLNSQ